MAEIVPFPMTSSTATAPLPPPPPMDDAALPDPLLQFRADFRSLLTRTFAQMAAHESPEEIYRRLGGAALKMAVRFLLTPRARKAPLPSWAAQIIAEAMGQSRAQWKERQ